MGGMADMPMEIKPVPLIALSLAATTAAIFALAKDHQKMVAGKSEPDDEERVAILSAMLLVGAARGQATREELMDVYRIVTSHSLDYDLMDLSFTRFQGLAPKDLAAFHLAPLSSSIARRRVLASALLVGCAARTPDHSVSQLIERLTIEIGASASDVDAARQALADWQEGAPKVQGVSSVTLLRHRTLNLAPA